ncbi:MAG TPA: Gmad2 immunoglobulin-like domain-containing protein [Candidatus Paceibacterota bacterium]|nr:Gmad2 immunoglobulin-like domain-containing protein [Candidatus Paceibacterota bacterium]
MNKWMTLGIGVFVVAVAALTVILILPSPTHAPTKEHADTTDMGNAAELQDLIRVTTPAPGGTAGSPLAVSGEARGTWYFEASFPYELRDASGNVIAQGPVQAASDWMTTDFVPFTVSISYPAQPSGSHGTLILKKDNPSGLPENEKSLTIPVVF